MGRFLTTFRPVLIFTYNIIRVKFFEIIFDIFMNKIHWLETTKLYTHFLFKLFIYYVIGSGL